MDTSWLFLECLKEVSSVVILLLHGNHRSYLSRRWAWYVPLCILGHTSFVFSSFSGFLHG